MKRAVVAVVLLALFAGGYALGQSQGWPADQDGSQFKLYDVQSVNVNGGLANIDSCLVSPDSILFTPVLSSTDVTITRAAQNGSGALKIINGNQAGFIDLGVEQTLLRMTAQGLDNGGVNFSGATYFGVRSDTTAAYPGDRDYQQVYFAPRSIYEVSGSVVTPPLNGTTLLSPYYFRGETIGLDGTAGNNTRPDGISLGFFWDQPSLVAIHGFTANSYQTGEIFGPPCSGPTCYGLRIYGGSSDNSERVAGTYVADGLGGSGTRCVQVDNSGVMSIAASACGSGAGTVTAVSATNPLFITGGASPTPNVTIQGSIVSGSTSTSAINLGTSVSNAILACSTASSTCTPTAVTVAGGLNYNTGTGTLSDGSFTCGANTFVSSSSTSGLACTQPAFSNLSGSLSCGQISIGAGLACAGGTYDESIPSSATTTFGGTTKTITTIGIDNYGRITNGTAISAFTCSAGASVSELTETSGPTCLTIGAIPDDAPYVDLLTRPAGSSTIVGVSRAALFGGPQTASVTANYVAYAPSVTGYGAYAIPYSTARTTADIQNAQMEVPVGFAVKKQRVMAWVTSNSLSSGGGGSPVTSCQSTQNGTGTGVFAGGGGGIPNTSTGLFDSGVQTVSSSADTDTWGLVCGGTSPTGGTINMTLTVIVYQ